MEKKNNPAACLIYSRHWTARINISKEEIKIKNKSMHDKAKVFFRMKISYFYFAVISNQIN